MTMRSCLVSVALAAVLVCTAGAVAAQTYNHPTLGQQNTYTGACMVTTCSGTYYDNGGAAGNYAAGVNNIFRTFCPNQAGMCVRATFTQFAMNDTYFLCFGPNSCCDYLSILNGPVQNSPALWSNCTASPGIITANNPSGCLTFRFVSDGSVQLAGWTATLSCVPCAGGPSGTSNSDCAYATPICSDTQLSDASPGPGINAEGCSGCVTSENYTNWYQVQIQTSGTLAFTIDPNNNSDDFDPVVFGPNVGCGSLGTPIRCSYAINAGNGNTGLGNGAADFSEDVSGNQWVAPINATAGQTYYIMINGWSAASGSNGFLLDWTGTASLNCTLPVELIHEGVDCADGQALIEWSTGSERGSSHFVVERSDDRAEWKPIAQVGAAGMSSSLTEYMVMDPMPASYGGYYRIRQVDANGMEVIGSEMRLEACKPYTAVLSLRPNPAGTEVQVDLGQALSEAVSEVVLLDAMGRPLRVIAAEGIGFGPNLSVSLQTLEAGHYQIAARGADGIILSRASLVKE